MPCGPTKPFTNSRFVKSSSSNSLTGWGHTARATFSSLTSRSPGIRTATARPPASYSMHFNISVGGRDRSSDTAWMLERPGVATSSSGSRREGWLASGGRDTAASTSAE